MNLPVDLQNEIINFLKSVPNINDIKGRQALIYSSGLDSQLYEQINFDDPPAQFSPLLLSKLIGYGNLSDGRNAIEAVLDGAKNYIGQDKRDYCNNLIEKLTKFKNKSAIQADEQIDKTNAEIIGAAETFQQVFISYAREDEKIAKKLYNDLKQLGINAWLDTEKLEPGQRWKDSIYQTIKNSAYFLALLSKHSLSKKGFVQKELKIALDILDEVPTTKSFIIPIRLADCIPNDERLRELHWVNLFTSYETGLQQIIKVLSPVQSHEKFSERLIAYNSVTSTAHEKKKRIKIGSSIIFIIILSSFVWWASKVIPKISILSRYIEHPNELMTPIARATVTPHLQTTQSQITPKPTQPITSMELTDDVEPQYEKFIRRKIKEISAFQFVINQFNSSFNGSYAIVIGIGEYDYLDHLESPQKDVQRMADFLINTDYYDEVIMLQDEQATFETIQYFLQTYFPKKMKTGRYRLLFYFTGRATILEGYNESISYLLLKRATGQQVSSDSINMNQLKIWADQLPNAKHILFLIDTAFSGASETKITSNFFDNSLNPLELSKENGRYMITAAAKDEMAIASLKYWNGSLFTDAALKGMDGQADSNDDGIVTTYELFSYIRTTVSQEAKKYKRLQNPSIINIGSEEDKGQYFFEYKPYEK
jgi:hypothetical protein